MLYAKALASRNVFFQEAEWAKPILTNRIQGNVWRHVIPFACTCLHNMAEASEASVTPSRKGRKWVRKVFYLEEKRKEDSKKLWEELNYCQK